MTQNDHLSGLGALERRSLEQLIAAAERLPLLEAALHERNQQLDDVRTLRHRLDETEQQLENTRTSLTREKETRLLELDSHNSQRTTLKRQIDEARQALHAAKERLQEERYLRDTLNKRVSELRQSSESLEAELKERQQQLATAKEHLDHERDRLATLNQHVGELRQHNEDLEAELSDAKSDALASWIDEAVSWIAGHAKESDKLAALTEQTHDADSWVNAEAFRERARQLRSHISRRPTPRTTTTTKPGKIGGEALTRTPT